MGTKYVAKCLEKIQKHNWYANKQEAEEVAARINKTSGDRPIAYLCEYCGKYHVGRRRKS